MAADEEGIEIVVTDGGTTAQLIAQLEALGVAGDQATARVATGFTRAATSQQALVSNSVLLSRAAQANSADLSVLASALDAMTSAELNAAARSDVLTTSWKAQQDAAVALAAENDALADSLAAESVTAERAAGSFAALAAEAGLVAAAEARTITTTRGLTDAQVAEAASANSAGTANARNAEETTAAGVAAVGASSKFKLLEGAIAGVIAYVAAKELGQASDEYIQFGNKVNYANSQVNALGIGSIQANGRLTVLDGSVQDLGATSIIGGAALTKIGTGLDTVATTSATANANLIKIGAVVNAANTSFQAATNNVEKYQTAQTGLSNAVDAAKQALVNGTGTLDAYNAALSAQAAGNQNLTQAIAAKNAVVALGTTGQSAYTSASADSRQVLDQLTASAVANGQTLESTVDLYAKLRQATGQLGVTNQQVIQTVQGVEDILKVAGIGAQQTNAAIRELSEGFNSGTIAARQFQALEREAPAIITAVGQASGQTVEELKKSGITVQQFIQAITQQFTSLESNAKNSMGTIAQAFTAVEDQFETYIGKSNAAFSVTNILIGAIRSIGNNINVIVPLLIGLAGAFAAVKIAGLIGEIGSFVKALITGESSLAAFSALFSPLGIAITAVAAVIGYLVNSYAEYLVSTGQASDKTAAFKLILNQIEAACQPVVDVFKNVVIYIGNMINGFTGATDKGTDLAGAIKAIGSALQTAAPLVSSFIAGLLQGLSDVVTTALRVGQVLGQVINVFRGIQGADSVGTNLTPYTNVTGSGASTSSAGTANRSGGVYAFADGGSMTIPGADSPDTVPLNMLVSRGERVLVQTPQQQATHNAIYAAFADFVSGGPGLAATVPTNVNAGGAHRSGGIIRAASGAVIGAGPNSFIASNDNSVAGYQGFTVSSPTAKAVAAATTSATAATTTAAAKTAAAANSSDGSSGFTPTWDNQGVHTAVTGQAATSNGDSYNYDSLALFLQNLSVSDDVWWGPSNGNPITTGLTPQGTLYITYQGNVMPWFIAEQQVQNPAGQGASGGHGFNNSINPNTGQNQVNFFGEGPNTVAGNTGGQLLRSGGIIYARDGVDFMVPGTGAVDSRSVNMAVSPGERVSVQTPDQQAKAGQGGGTVNNFHTTVQTPNASSFQRSQRSLGQQIAATAKRAGLGS